MSGSNPHIAIIPNAGMGNLIPFFRLASVLLSNNCKVTLITGKPITSMAEANHLNFFLTKHPKITHLEYQILPPEPNSKADPFFLQYNAVRRSTHLIHPLLRSTTFSTIICSFLGCGTIPRFAVEIGVPCYVFNLSSTKFFSFMMHLPAILKDPEISDKKKNSSFLEVPGLAPFDMSSIPGAFLNPKHLMAVDAMVNAKACLEATGIITNSFEWLEPETFSALNSGKVIGGTLPPVLPIGPLEWYEVEEDQTDCVAWLDNQPHESVVFVNFGSRTPMSSDQIREMGKGLERSGSRFLWVLKTTIIDKDEDRQEDVLGVSFLDRTKEKGLVLRKWVNQQEVLSHPSIGLFVSHCGWSSSTEAALRGIPLLGWPQLGDHSVNAEVVEKAGLGKLARSWGFGLERLVDGEEIAAKIMEMMGDGKLRSSAKKVKEEAMKATEPGGSSHRTIMKIVGS
uniref:Glycosyltransferase n=1 Tax=Hypericum perforatum TaxID=65561 RepID=A0A8D5UBW1_HYPPE|nr:norathyriol 4-C-glycosyltransferase [Hypericum perforatum]